MVFDLSKTAGSVTSNGDPVDEHGPGGKYGYRIGHRDEHYSIPDVILNSPGERKLKVLTVGAGISGILMAYLIQKHMENVEHVVYEKNGDIGGTWLENRYPGCACDVPAHAYTYAFALNPDWPKYLSPSADIYRYLNRVVECFDLRKYMRFNSANLASGEVTEEVADVVLGAYGVLNSWKYPEEVKGLRTFKGRLVHTARWPDDYSEAQWKGQRVAVIGSGATSIQTVPSMQPHVKQLDAFVRTPVWFAEIADHKGENFDYPAEQRRTFTQDTDALVDYAKSLEAKLNSAAGIKSAMSASAESRAVRDYFTAHMKEHITRQEILDLLLPTFSPGCRRLTPGVPYMRAVQQPNVRLHRCAVTEVTSSSIIGSNGDEVEVDTIVCATGFDVSYKPRFPVRGRNGTLLQEVWKQEPTSYMSMAVPDFPNYFIFAGPTFPIANGSVLGPIQAVGDYVIQVLQKMQRENIHSLSPRADVTAAFNHHAQTWYKGTAWEEASCRSWYKNNLTGRVNAIWPGSSLHFCEAISTPRYEDYEIKYTQANMWAYLGLGFTKAQSQEDGDLSPYIQKERVEKGFYSFRAPADEEQRIASRSLKVNDWEPAGSAILL
ncbi:putative sterigmatocystin biosynthesis monooxygenase stcW [Aspergillus unguis]